uniref:Small ribosomal subunit protein uS15m n=1 Tax=Culicoides sonorensis TaxID=179676 RepID=A0A336LLG2_CULSO
MNIVKSFTNIIPIIRPSISRGYAMRSDLKIKWIRPEKVSCIVPEKSGDCSPLPMVDPKKFMFDFQNNKALQDADEKVKDLFRIENNPRREKIRHVIQDTVGKVNRHELDFGSMEAKIAKMTAQIRSWQEVMEKFPRNKILKVKLKEKIDKRRKFLLYLRRWDYRRYEWILEELDLVLKLSPDEVFRVERKASLRKLTALHCDDIRQKRLDEYRKKLESQQLDFLEKKFKNLEFIRNEQIACKVKVTVTEDMVKEAKAKYESMLEKQKKLKDEEDLKAEMQ